jgi:hypothetical protein
MQLPFVGCHRARGPEAHHPQQLGALQRRDHQASAIAVELLVDARLRPSLGHAGKQVPEGDQLGGRKVERQAIDHEPVPCLWSRGQARKAQLEMVAAFDVKQPSPARNQVGRYRSHERDRARMGDRGFAEAEPAPTTGR